MMQAFANNRPGGPPGSGIRDTMERIQKEFQASMTHVLDADQKEAFEEMIKEQQSSRGTLYRLNEDGKLVAIPVQLGASDPSNTEITGPGIEEGMEVIYSVQ